MEEKGSFHITDYVYQWRQTWEELKAEALVESCLWASSQTTYVSYIAQAHGSRDAISHSGLNLLISIANQEIALQIDS